MALKETYKKGFVELILLKMLSEGEMYGYQITQTVAKRSNGVVEVPEGSLYPTVYSLVDRGFIVGERRSSGKRQTRVYYTLTEEGKEHLKVMLREYDRFLVGMDRVLFPEKNN